MVLCFLRLEINAKSYQMIVKERHIQHPRYNPRMLIAAKISGILINTYMEYAMLDTDSSAPQFEM